MLKSGVSRREFLVGASVAAFSLRGRNLWAQTDGRALVTTSAGVLRGESADGVRVFRGVPFAEPPVGPLRFRAPVKKAAWQGERDATKFAAAAMQGDSPNFPISEDCLYLNVWSPEGAKGLPVYVWIHGGGFTGGSSFAAGQDGSGFAREGVIVVSLAYRLGVFGFLDVSPLLGQSYAGSANNAMRDLILALQWVQENITAFGGDPKRITVGGQSAGAKLTDMLMGVAETRGLFAQAISESGGAERIADRDHALAVGKGFGATWGKDPALLKTAPPEDLIVAQGSFIRTWPQHFPLRAEVDGELVKRLPVEVIASGTMRGRRLLIGTNLEESASFLGPHPKQDPGAKDLGNVSVQQFEAVFAKYPALYPKMDEDHLRIRAATAEEYWVPSVRVADACVKGGGKAWMYRLDFPDPAGEDKGYAHHSEELNMAWGRRTRNPAEAQLAASIHAAWLSFIKGEAPHAEGLPEWPEYSVGERKTMVLNVPSHVETRPMEQELRLWDGLI